MPKPSLQNLLSLSRFLTGFTLIEILIVIGLLALLAGFTVVASFDFYRGYALRSEVNMVVGVLQKARSRALSNLNQTSHGVHVGPEGYTIFEGPTFSASSPANLLVPAQSAIKNNGVSDVIFAQLTARTSSSTITLNDNTSHTNTISVNAEGRINW